jgi:anaerobic selenocysteine-containing dehydrogenase
VTTVEEPATPSPARTATHTCHLCESMCGIRLAVEGDAVLSIRPNKDDSWSHGHICPKGLQLGRIHEDVDRVRAPMVRDGSEWREVSWAEAFAKCEEIIHGVIERHLSCGPATWSGTTSA